MPDKMEESKNKDTSKTARDPVWSMGRNIVVDLDNDVLDIGKLEQVSFESKEELLRLAHSILLKDAS